MKKTIAILFSLNVILSLICCLQYNCIGSYHATVMKDLDKIDEFYVKLQDAEDELYKAKSFIESSGMEHRFLSAKYERQLPY